MGGARRTLGAAAVGPAQKLVGTPKHRPERPYLRRERPRACQRSLEEPHPSAGGGGGRASRAAYWAPPDAGSGPRPCRADWQQPASQQQQRRQQQRGWIADRFANDLQRSVAPVAQGMNIHVLASLHV